MSYIYNQTEQKSLNRFAELKEAMNKGRTLSTSTGVPIRVLQVDMSTHSIDAHDGEFNGVGIPLGRFDDIMQSIVIR